MLQARICIPDQTARSNGNKREEQLSGFFKRRKRPGAAASRTSRKPWRITIWRRNSGTDSHRKTWDTAITTGAICRSTSVQTKDIIVYFDSNGYPLHSGVVYSVSPLGELTICSKWGQAGVYIHSIGNVPLEYCSNPYTGDISCVIFSYHDYVNQYTGNNYHAGVRHFYEYADICEVCNKQINETWTRTICSGPPCPVFRTK